MRTDIVLIDNQGNGFGNAIEEAKKIAQFNGMQETDSLHLQLFTEELLSMARSVTGEMKASFWIDNNENSYDLNLATDTVMDKKKRDLILSASNNRKNEAAKTFLGMLRDAFEQAMLTTEENSVIYDFSDDMDSNNTGSFLATPEWDRYESSILSKLADDVKIGIVGGKVHMKVSKTF